MRVSCGTSLIGALSSSIPQISEMRVQHQQKIKMSAVMVIVGRVGRIKSANHGQRASFMAAIKTLSRLFF